MRVLEVNRRDPDPSRKPGCLTLPLLLAADLVTLILLVAALAGVW